MALVLSIILPVNLACAANKSEEACEAFFDSVMKSEKQCKIADKLKNEQRKKAIQQCAKIVFKKMSNSDECKNTEALSEVRCGFNFVSIDSPECKEIEAKKEGRQRQEVIPKFIEMHTFTSDLNQEQGDNASHFIQIEFALKVAQPSLEQKISEHSHKIDYEIILILSRKYERELLSAEGKLRLAEEIQTAINNILETNSDNGVMDVLFTKFIMD